MKNYNSFFVSSMEKLKKKVKIKMGNIYCFKNISREKEKINFFFQRLKGN